MMNKLRQRTDKNIRAELKEANKNNPQFATAHEGIAVLYEEFEETKDEMLILTYDIRSVWEEIKTDDLSEKSLKTLYGSALNMACEVQQVAAMALKLKRCANEKHIE